MGNLLFLASVEHGAGRRLYLSEHSPGSTTIL
jgi:hypothetical protein